jgi:hypothetical protein
MEWIEFGQHIWDLQQLGLHKPGTLIDTEDGVYLIGDINTNGGFCDCCLMDSLIHRYKVIYDPSADDK